MTIDLDALEKLAKEARPGKRRVYDCGGRRYRGEENRACGIESEHMAGERDEEPVLIFESDNRDECSHPILRSEADFIAATDPDSVLELISEIRRLRHRAIADLGATGQCIEEHIWPGHPRYDALMGIVSDLAADDGAMLRDDIDQLCRRARELVGGGE